MAQVRKSVLQGRILLATQETALHVAVEQYLLREPQHVLHVHQESLPILLMFHVCRVQQEVIVAAG